MIPRRFGCRTEIAPFQIHFYSLPSDIHLTVLDQCVPAGVTEVQWSGRNAQGPPVGSGLYLAKLEVGGRSVTSKVTLLK